jgi:chromosome segregation ATPase
MRSMFRAAAALVLVALVAASCGEDKPAVATQAELEAAQAETQEALDAIGSLEGRIADLESTMERKDRAADDLVSGLSDTLDQLKASLKRIKAAAAQASSSAQLAAGEISAAVRRLTVLEDRYDYHLKRYHGGG